MQRLHNLLSVALPVVIPPAGVETNGNPSWWCKLVGLAFARFTVARLPMRGGEGVTGTSGRVRAGFNFGPFFRKESSCARNGSAL